MRAALPRQSGLARLLQESFGTFAAHSHPMEDSSQVRPAEFAGAVGPGPGSGLDIGADVGEVFAGARRDQ